MKKYIFLCCLISTTAFAQHYELPQDYVSFAFEQINKRPKELSEVQAQKLYLNPGTVDTLNKDQKLVSINGAYLPFIGVWKAVSIYSTVSHDGNKWVPKEIQSSVTEAEIDFKIIVCILSVIIAVSISFLFKKNMWKIIGAVGFCSLIYCISFLFTEGFWVKLWAIWTAEIWLVIFLFQLLLKKKKPAVS